MNNRGKSISGRHNNTSTRILEFLQKNSNLEITYSAMMRDLGLPDYSVSNGVGYLIQKGFPIDRPMRGVAIYRTLPSKHADEIPPVMEPKTPPIKLYEYVGVSTGRIIVRDEDEELYYLTPLFS